MNNRGLKRLSEAGIKDDRVIWKPQPKQEAFMSRSEPEAFYGGAAGGGKSDALVAEALRQVHIPHYKGLILRKTYPELRELIDKTRLLYPQVVPGCRYNSTEHAWHFPSGAQIIFSSLQRPADRYKFAGIAYQFIGFDELTHFSHDEYIFLMSRNRPNGSGVRCYIRSTGNPGSVGHAWVKARFVDPAPPMTPIPESVDWYAPDGTHYRQVRNRIYVPATVYDNHALMSHDPAYVARLASMPEAERDALLYGSWSSFSGQVYREFTDDPAHYKDRAWTHVIEPFDIPAHWQIWCGLDWGYSKPFSVGWFAVDTERRMYHIAEYYGCTGTPDTGVLLEPSTVAREIRRIEAEHPLLQGRRIFRVGDPAIWQSDGTESIGALMERERVYFEKGDHARIAGKMQLHHRLAFDQYGIPMLYVFNTCRHFIRTIPALVYDETHVEDVNTKGEDHIYDMTRYVAMRNAIAERPHIYTPPKAYSPLDSPADIYADRMAQRYEFYKRY